MSYRNQYSGSPWQQGGPPFGVGGSYGQGYSSFDDQYQMMNMGNFARNQGGYGGGIYGSGGGGGGSMGPMRNVGYSGQSRQWNDRMGGGGRQMPRGQMQRKRLPPRSPASGPRSKRPNLGSSSGGGGGGGGDRRAPPSDKRPRKIPRDSRDGSKTRGKDGEEDAYNPEEPTADDASDIDLEGYGSFKSDEEEPKPVEAEDHKQENGTQEPEEKEEDKKDAAQDVKKETDVVKKPTEEAKKAEKPKKPPICYVCKVKCSSDRKYQEHAQGADHKAKIDEILAIRKGDKPDDKESADDKDGRDSKKKSRKPGNWCTVCECIFVGNFLAHRRTKEHRKKRDKKYPKCRPCRLGFSSSEEYRDHYKSEDHKQRSAEFHYLKGLASGSDDDEEAIKPAPVEVSDVPIKTEPETTDEPKEDEKANESTEMDTSTVEVKKEDDAEQEKEEESAKNDDVKKKEEEKKDTSKPAASDPKKDKRPREPKAQGQSFVVSVQGYYCKLCHKFFKDVTIAKSKHCRSVMHINAFKDAMDKAFRQEEERQALADEQDRLDREVAEAAELAAEIAQIEKEAKEAEKRKTAAERNKGKDVEMKDEEGLKDVKTEPNEENGEDNSKSDVKIKQEPGKDNNDVAKTPKQANNNSPAARRGRGRGRGRRRR